MSQRRNVMRDGVSTGRHQQDDRDDEEEASSSLFCVSSREKRRRQRENKLRTKDLSEEEMMDLALQLSEQEASVAALRLQKEEEEDVMKAIKESMILHNHRPQSPSLLADVEAPNGTCSRRKLTYSNGTSAVDEDETQLISGEKSSVEVKRRQNKQNVKPGSPLLEMPDLSQTQNLDSGSAGGSEVVDLSQDSSQSSDSTLIDDSHPPKSPVFPSTCCQAEVLVQRLSQNLLQSCKSSGFVLCSQDSHMSPKSMPDGAKSPTFPQSPQHSRGPPSQKTLVSSKPDQGHIRDRSPDSCGSPGVCRPHDWTSGFTFSSQDSLTSSVVSTSCRSPVFPRTGPPSSEVSQTESGPVFLRTEPPQTSRSLKRNQDSDGAGRQGDQIEDVNDSPGSVSGVKVAVRADSEEAELSSNMTLHWSDSDDDVTPVASPSPVFPAETKQDANPSEPTGSNCRGHRSNTKPQPISSHGADRGAGYPAACGSTVHYYWGVPFCPRGLDPDRYTQVIVEQMEVYKKSLKEAQRNLLRKAPWGEGIQPQPEGQQENSLSSDSPAEVSEDLPPQRRPRNKKWGNAADSPPARAEEKEDGEEVEHTETHKKESRSRVGGGEQMETDDCEVPETQLSEDERTQDVIVVRDVRAERQMKSAELPDVQMILQLESSPAQKKVEEEEEEKEEVMEVDVRHTEGNSPEGRSPPARPARGDKEAETQDEQLLSAMPPEQEMAVDVQEASVDCPICQGSFPASQIEMHAAYCDGTPVDSHRRREAGDSIPVSVRPRRKRRRGVEATDGESSPASNTSRKLEKCYICHLVVPLQDYNRHKELCIHRHSNTSAAKENLLSAVEKTDNRPSDVRPSGSRLQHGDVIDLRNDDDDVEEEEEEGGGVSSIRISNSPIRSFTPISEATDCLIDFHRQHRSKKQGRRRR